MKNVRSTHLLEQMKIRLNYQQSDEEIHNEKTKALF